MNNPAIYIFLLVFNLTTLFSQELSTEESDLSNYRTIQYITSSWLSPKRAMYSDNNADILLACINGKTEADLRNLNIEFNDSQIMLLRAVRLLDVKGDTLRTAFTILGSAKTERLRSIANTAAEKLYPKLIADIDELILELAKMNRQRNTYSILFSFVLDGLIWNSFEERGLIDEMEITAEKPFWDGTVWSLFPLRSFSCGTNISNDRGIALYMNWSKHAPRLIWEFWGNYKYRRTLIKNFADNGKVTNPEVIRDFLRFHLFDENGNVAIPVIEATHENRLYAISHRIVEKIADTLPELLDFPQLTSEFKFKNNAQIGRAHV